MSHDSRRAALGIARLNKQIEAIKNSNLSPEEKEKALKSQRKLL